MSYADWVCGGFQQMSGLYRPFRTGPICRHFDKGRIIVSTKGLGKSPTPFSILMFQFIIKENDLDGKLQKSSNYYGQRQ